MAAVGFDADPVVLDTYEEAREALRNKDLRQALYDDGAALMSDVIVNLHGAAHTARRRLENRLFRRDTFSFYEREIIPAAIEGVLKPALERGRGDLLDLGRRTMISLSTAIAGVDVSMDDREELDRFYSIMVRLNRGSNVVHATGDHSALTADGLLALDEFNRSFLLRSIDHRRHLLDEFQSGGIAEDELPRDVLTTLMRNQDDLDLPDETILREVAYFPWVGSFSTSDAFVHAMDHLLTWLDEHPDSRETLRSDRALLQRFVHESIRLHPASPEARRIALADVTLSSGRVIPTGTGVVVNLVSANRDPKVFGAHTGAFYPYREISSDVSPWGLSFGHGFHACLGQELAGGLAPGMDFDPSTHLFGAITVMAAILLDHGVHRDEAAPPRQDPLSTRPHFDSFAVVFDGQ